MIAWMDTLASIALMVLLVVRRSARASMTLTLFTDQQPPALCCADLGRSRRQLGELGLVRLLNTIAWIPSQMTHLNPLSLWTLWERVGVRERSCGPHPSPLPPSGPSGRGGLSALFGSCSARLWLAPLFSTCVIRSDRPKVSFLRTTNLGCPYLPPQSVSFADPVSLSIPFRETARPRRWKIESRVAVASRQRDHFRNRL